MSSTGLLACDALSSCPHGYLTNGTSGKLRLVETLLLEPMPNVLVPSVHVEHIGNSLRQRVMSKHGSAHLMCSIHVRTRDRNQTCMMHEQENHEPGRCTSPVHICQPTIVPNQFTKTLRQLHRARSHSERVANSPNMLTD